MVFPTKPLYLIRTHVYSSLSIGSLVATVIHVLNGVADLEFDFISESLTVRYTFIFIIDGTKMPFPRVFLLGNVAFLLCSSEGYASHLHPLSLLHQLLYSGTHCSCEGLLIQK